MPPDEDATPAKDGLIMFVSFVLFGMIPKLRTFICLLAMLAWSSCTVAMFAAFIFLVNKKYEPGEFNPQFMIAALLSAAAMFLLGVVKVCSVLGHIRPHVMKYSHGRSPSMRWSRGGSQGYGCL